MGRARGGQSASAVVGRRGIRGSFDSWPAVPTRTAEGEKIRRQYDTLLAMMDATPASSGWPTAEMARELATELRAKEREILDFNGLPEVTRFRELAQHASGQPFQQGIAILIPFHDPTGKVKNGGGAFSALGFAFVSETAAAAVSQKRTQTETWEDGESTSWTAADARSCCVHELIHLTQTSPSVEVAPRPVIVLVEAPLDEMENAAK